MAAAWSVHAISSSTLRAETCGQQRPDDGQRRPTPASGNRSNAGHQVSPATIHSGPDASTVRIASQALCRSSVPTSWVSSSTRSRTSPTACSVSADSGWCRAASSRSARSRPSARSTTPAHSVRPAVSSTRRADDARRRAARPAWPWRARRAAGDHRARARWPTAATAQARAPTRRPGRAAAASRRCCRGSGGGAWVGTVRPDSSRVRDIAPDGTTKHRQPSCGLSGPSGMSRGGASSAVGLSPAGSVRTACPAPA